MHKVFFIAEIGINHNGDMNLAKQLIDVACQAGCDAVKFQKRTIDKVYTPEFLASSRQSPWGTTQREQKEGLEFNQEQYEEIDRYCSQKKIEWFASTWDVDAQKFLRNFNLKYNKIASAMLGNFALLEEVAWEKRHTFISTGMSTYEEIDAAVALFQKYHCPYEILHCNSTYPMQTEDANLRLIPELRKKYQCDVGFSSHEIGYVATLGAVALGAVTIERHITLNRNMYGSDQKASIEPQGLFSLVKDIRAMEQALGNGEKILDEKEMAVRKKLRG
ncbi:N-acetylneuraminate synthase [Sporomusaceae bacterium BoRhaA]|uniref:N-acetylneuraminate synthase family protein n=1 Tax=Pelorhabdus rhamnosifermentans TaxID=2772457 RepID=UPI001FE8EDEB|nr:N-acetylneuraminate synthase family protein [Pelorhabdus rhamnosifermentans]MBU2703221.1 N-acetylneuraminate synthase [Pelorhabdus rhamnosifermentans]